jgi:hypothetical protein
MAPNGRGADFPDSCFLDRMRAGAAISAVEAIFPRLGQKEKTNFQVLRKLANIAY